MNNLPTGTVTFLFTDIEGSTQHWEKRPREMKPALAKHDAILKQAIETNHGFVIKTTGDGVHAVFSTALDAINSAIQAQGEIGATDFFNSPEVCLRVRMGLHTGEAEQRDGDYYGQSLNRAARIMSVGHGGQILISSTTSDLVRENFNDDVSLLDLGEHHLKGILHQEHIYQLVTPGLKKDFPALNSIQTAMHNLPTQLTTFIGRQRERAEVNEKLKSTRLLTLIGPGGTGKTRLSLQVAEDQLAEYKDGVWFMELAPLADPKLILQSIARVFNLHAQLGMPLQEIIIDYLRAKNLLVILDNCEHVVEACAQFADQLLRSSPQVKMLISSREALGIDGEAVYRVPSLTLPDLEQVTFENLMSFESAQLLVERARAANRGFQVTDKNFMAIAQICIRLDGIPLALELAAARVTLFSAEQIAVRLDDRFRLLTGGSRTALPRQQTLRALIDWSHDLLSPDERSLLRRLSVFAGGWSFDAAEAMCPTLDVLSLLSQLVNKSLVTVDEGRITRYRLLETIRQYARDKLLEMGESEQARNAHLNYFVSFAENAGLQIDNKGLFDWIPVFIPEYDNFRAAFEWSLETNIEACVRLIGDLAIYLFLRGHGAEGIQMAGIALERAKSLPKPVDEKEAQRRMAMLAKAFEGMSFLAYSQGDNQTALEAGENCIILARQLKDPRTLAIGLAYTGSCRLFMGDIAGAASQIEEAEKVARASHEKAPLGMVLGVMAQLAMVRDRDLQAAQRYEDEGLELTADGVNSWISSMLSFGTARGAMYRGEYAAARERFLKCLPLFEEIKDEHRINMIHSEFAHIDRFEGRYAQAKEGYRKTILVWQKLGHRAAVSHQFESFAMIAVAEGRHERAAHLFGAAEILREKINIQMTPPEHVLYEKQVAILRASIKDQSRFTAMWAEGRTMSMEEAIQYCLQEEK